MGNMSFVIWMILFPVATEITESINLLVHHKCGLAQKKYSDRTEMLVSVIYFVLWLFVGILLYKA